MFGAIIARPAIQRSIRYIVSLLHGQSLVKAKTEREWLDITANHAQNQCRCGLFLECGNYKNKSTMRAKARD